MTDYNVIDAVETFDVNSQQVGSFFVTPPIVKQIQSPKPSIRIRCREDI